jgi:hypothetical protein
VVLFDRLEFGLSGIVRPRSSSFGAAAFTLRAERIRREGWLAEP